MSSSALLMSYHVCQQPCSARLRYVRLPRSTARRLTLIARTLADLALPAVPGAPFLLPYYAARSILITIYLVLMYLTSLFTFQTSFLVYRARCAPE
jgi:hypothetical protein